MSHAPIAPPLAPQLARRRSTLPDPEGWAFEPKLDGFRVIAFVDGETIDLRSRNDKPLTRYFPEISLPRGRYVLDGEIVIRDPEGAEHFSLLQQRIHPAASRIETLSSQIPAVVVAFDLLAHDDEWLLDRPFQERRSLLERHLSQVERTPLTGDIDRAREWLRTREGVIAKELDAPYRPGQRTGMVKIKRVRTMDCVVMGYREGKIEGTVGSLILGAFTPEGTLRPVGHTSGFSKKQKTELPALLAPYESGERGAADPSRWSADRELEWVSLRPELVVEVAYDHASDGRIRHGAKVVRWRDDRDPASCLTDQLDE